MWATMRLRSTKQITGNEYVAMHFGPRSVGTGEFLLRWGGWFVGKKKSPLLTFLYTVLPLYSPLHAGEQKYSHNHEQGNTVAVQFKTSNQIH